MKQWFDKYKKNLLKELESFSTEPFKDDSDVSTLKDSDKPGLK